MTTHLSGRELLRDSLLNKDTAFSLEERDQYGLYGLLPCQVETIDQQLIRVRGAFLQKTTDLEKHIYLRALQDRNEVLFYRFVLTYLEEIMPLIYTPVVGEACQLFHRIYRQPRGLFISYTEKDRMREIIASVAIKRDIRVIVVTDGERILGLGDQGVGGLGIPIGKLSLYSVCGGIHPRYTLPIILDVGTNNEERLNDLEYLGWRHRRITGQTYLDFVDEFVHTIQEFFPNVLLQFEDFAQQNAYPLLHRYRTQLCMFNDDIQGTASVVVAAVLAAVKVSQVDLKDHRIAVFGAGSAGCGIAEQLVQAMVAQGIEEHKARKQFYLIDRSGLLHDKLHNLLTFQLPFARTYQELSSWGQEHEFSLADVIDHAKPTILIGVSGQPNQFTAPIVEKMAQYCQHPIIFPLSNPTSRAEAIPRDLLNWTQGKALIATGSPFEPVEFNGQSYPIAQSNNSYIFPGIGLAVVAGKIKRISDRMMLASAFALSELAPAIKQGRTGLLPPLTEIRDVSQHIAKAIIQEAIREGYSQVNLEDVEQLIADTMWDPNYN